MSYVSEDGGRLNVYAVEPKMKAEPVTDAQKRNYVILSIVGVLLMVGLCAVAAFVS
ncbi:MAG: ssl1498 family light-harvesting-like protein [Cyanothece sp. SIO1E1]|nr:ssl1498 family light-harvesting-like protein [Cyanothece sp. SIO1E1]